MRWKNQTGSPGGQGGRCCPYSPCFQVQGRLVLRTWECCLVSARWKRYFFLAQHIFKDNWLLKLPFDFFLCPFHFLILLTDHRCSCPPQSPTGWYKSPSPATSDRRIDVSWNVNINKWDTTMQTFKTKSVTSVPAQGLTRHPGRDRSPSPPSPSEARQVYVASGPSRQTRVLHPVNVLLLQEGDSRAIWWLTLFVYKRSNVRSYTILTLFSRWVFTLPTTSCAFSWFSDS